MSENLNVLPQQDFGVRMYGFNYAIGQVVRLKAGGVAKNWHSRDRNYRWMVNSQELEICSGGLQRKYSCRGGTHGGSVGTNPILFHEHELEASEPFPCETEDKNKKIEETA